MTFRPGRRSASLLQPRCALPASRAASRSRSFRFSRPTAFRLIASGSGRQSLVHREATADKIGRITPHGVVTEFLIATSGSSTEGNHGGPGGNMWFTEFDGNRIGRITPAGVDQRVSHGPPARHRSGPWASRPGRMATSGSRNTSRIEIGRITTSGAITEFDVPTPGSQPYGIAPGPDGNLWFAETGGSKIGRITTSGVITEFPVPTAATVSRPGSRPDRTATSGSPSSSATHRADHDRRAPSPSTSSRRSSRDRSAFAPGRMEISGSPRSPSIRLRASRRPASSRVRDADHRDRARRDVAGADANLWFTESGANQIGRISTTACFPGATDPLPERPLSGNGELAASGQERKRNGQAADREHR